MPVLVGKRGANQNQNHPLRWLLVAVLIALLGIAGLQPQGEAGAQPPLGSRENPIIWLLPPSTLPATVEEIGRKIAEDLSEMTGLYIKPVVAADYAALIETMIVAKGNTMACPPTDAYVQITMRNPKVHPRLAAVRYGYPYYFSSIYAFREKGFQSVEDLEGTVWIYNDPGSTSGYKLPKALFDKLGIKIAGTVESGGHTNSIVALMEGQGDFCTGYGSPPLPPSPKETCAEACLVNFEDCKASGAEFETCLSYLIECLQGCEKRWEYGMDPELWLWNKWKGELWPEGLRGKCVDLRRALAKTGLYGDIWEIVEKIGVVATIGPVPNDCLAFCEDFPRDIENKIVQAVIEHIRSPEGHALWNDPNFYEWDDVEPIDDSYYDAYRELMGYPVPER